MVCYLYTLPEEELLYYIRDELKLDKLYRQLSKLMNPEKEQMKYFAALFREGHYFSEEALRKQLEKAYPGLVFTEESLEKQINMHKRDKVGHILSLTVGNETISGEEFRKLLELPSSNFTMQAADGKIRFLCKGQGHGLGLSQYGGNVLAKEGKSYREILRYYFPECEVKKEDS